MSVRLRILGDAAPKIPGELSAFTFASEVTARMDAYPKHCEYGALSAEANKHYNGDEAATQFLCALLHGFHKNFLMIILDFCSSRRGRRPIFLSLTGLALLANSRLLAGPTDP